MENIEFYKLFDGDYEISKCGKVRRKYKNGVIRYLKPWIDTGGYLRIKINEKKDKKRKKYRLHRLLALTFIDNPDNKPCVDHINRNKLDNRIENLRWATYQENTYNRTLKGYLYKQIKTYKCGISERWIGGYTDENSNRIIKTFKTKEEAQKFRDENLQQRVIKV